MPDSPVACASKHYMPRAPGNIDEAKSLLREADGYARQAHHMQTKLIEQDAGEARQPMTLIMVHAQDHLMTSLLARELSEEIIHLYQR